MIFCCKKNMEKNNLFLIDNLQKCEPLEKKINITCSFNNVKCIFKHGRILILRNTNISFIEPHKSIIRIKDNTIILLFFNEDNLFLYNRTLPIDIKQLDKILKTVKRWYK